MKTGMMARARLALAAGGVAFALTTAACSDETPFQVIEELDFAPSLGVDLAMMQQTANGVYFEDLVVGTGNDTLRSGSYTFFDHNGWLADGTLFSTGKFSITVTTDSLIAGFVEGVDGMIEGGTRLLVIPPELGYGARGNRSVPPGAVLVFEVVVDSIP